MEDGVYNIDKCVLPIQDTSFDHVVIRHGVRAPKSLHSFAEKPKLPPPKYAGERPQPMWRAPDEADEQVNGYEPSDVLLASAVTSPWNTATIEDIARGRFGTFFGQYNTDRIETRTFLQYFVRLFKDRPVNNAIIRESKGHHPFEHPLFFDTSNEARPQSLFPESSVFRTQLTKIRRYKRRSNYHVWLIINDGSIADKELDVGWDRDEIISREVLNFSSEKPSVDFKELSRRVLAYLNLQRADERYTKLVSVWLDGVELKVSDVLFEDPNPVIKVIFEHPDELQGAAWSPELDHTLRCVCWGVQSRNKAFPFLITGDTKHVECKLFSEIDPRADHCFRLDGLTVGGKFRLLPGEYRTAKQELIQKTGIDTELSANTISLKHSQTQGQKDAEKSVTFIALDVQESIDTNKFSKRSQSFDSLKLFAAIVDNVRKLSHAELLAENSILQRIPLPIPSKVCTTEDRHKIKIEAKDKFHEFKMARSYDISVVNFYRNDAWSNPIYRRNFLHTTHEEVWGNDRAWKALKRLNKMLKPELEVLVLDAYRSVGTQKEIRECFRQLVQIAAGQREISLDIDATVVNAIREEFKTFRKNFKAENLDSLVESYCDKYYSRGDKESVVNDPSTWFIHATGGAFDLTLRTKGGRQFDMFCDFDEMGPYAEAAYFERPGNTALTHRAAAQKRRLLYWCLQKNPDELWINYPNEFFHFEFLGPSRFSVGIVEFSCKGEPRCKTPIFTSKSSAWFRRGKLSMWT